MSNLVNIDSSTKEKADTCRNLAGNPGAWAFEHEGEWYCFIENEKPVCARDESRMITRTLYDAGKEKTVTEKYHVCGVRNG